MHSPFFYTDSCHAYTDIIAAITGSVLGVALILAAAAFSLIALHYCRRSRKKSLRERLSARVIANIGSDPNDTEGTILISGLEDIPGDDDIPRHSATRSCSADGDDEPPPYQEAVSASCELLRAPPPYSSPDAVPQASTVSPDSPLHV